MSIRPNRFGIPVTEETFLAINNAGENDSKIFQQTPFLFGGENELQTLALVAVGVKLLKTETGQRIIRDVAIKYLDNLGRIVATLEASSASNWLTCAINQRLCARVLKNMGMISADEASEYMSWISWVVGSMIAKGYITETIGALSSLGNIGQWKGAL